MNSNNQQSKYDQLVEVNRLKDKELLTEQTKRLALKEEYDLLVKNHGLLISATKEDERRIRELRNDLAAATENWKQWEDVIDRLLNDVRSPTIHHLRVAAVKLIHYYSRNIMGSITADYEHQPHRADFAEVVDGVINEMNELKEQS